MSEPKIKGKVESKESKTGKSGASFYLFKIAGLTMSTFEKDYFDDINKDDEVEVTYKQNQVGDKTYNNITAMRVLNKAEGEPAIIEEETVGEIIKKFDQNNIQERIRLGQAMNLAMEVINNTKIVPAPKPEEVDVMFKEQTKRFFNLAKELQEEVLGGKSE